MAYDGAMKDVKHHHGEGGAGGSDSSDSSDSDDSSDEEGEAAKGKGKVTAVVAAKGNSKGKNKASSGSSVVHHRDGTVASASAAELKIAAKLAKDPWGR